MGALFASGRIVDLILLLVLLEALALAAWARRSRSGPGLAGLLPNLLAGAFLLLALRAALADAAWPWIAAALAGGLVAHLWDLSGRLGLAGLQPRGELVVERQPDEQVEGKGHPEGGREIDPGARLGQGGAAGGGRVDI